MRDAHEDHDLALVVAYADDELGGDDAAAALTLVETCPRCASLVTDLRSLSAADRAIATPPRPRDFRLTPADAARLTAAGPEPDVAAGRLTGAMTDLSPAHGTHDPLLIAAAADGSLEDADRTRVDDWLAGCSPCAELRADLVAIAAANRAMPTPPRPRDFQLTPADAQRATGRGWRGFVARIGTARDGFSRPLAAGLTALGLAGLLLSGGGSLLPSSSSGAAVLSTVGAAIPQPESKGLDGASAPAAVDDPNVFSGSAEGPAAAAPSAAASAAPANPLSGAAPAPQPDGPGPVEMQNSGSGSTDAYAAASAASSAAADDASRNGGASPSDATRSLTVEAPAAEGPPAGVLVSVGLLLAGLALFAFRWAARRRETT